MLVETKKVVRGYVKDSVEEYKTGNDIAESFFYKGFSYRMNDKKANREGNFSVTFEKNN